MKILIMGFTKLKYMPYMNFYLENIFREKNDIHILYWNRDLQDENRESFSDCLLHEVKYYQEDDVSKLTKLKGFYAYRKYAMKLLREENFDFIFILHSLTGVVVADAIRKRYKGKYIFDYRDSTYETLPPFKKIVGDLVKNSVATFVSSDAFRCFLPEKYKEKTYTSHNILTDSLNHRDDKRLYGIPSDKIRISFWGFIRHEEVNLELIKKIGNDERLELHYYGREQKIAENLKSYVKKNNIKNVFFHGEYKPEDRYEFIKSTDIIHNIYDDANTLLAMGNKYYDGAIFRIPQICTPGSFMGEQAEKGGIGKMLDYKSESFCDNLYNYYVKLDRAEFDKNCDSETEKFTEEYEIGTKTIKKISSK